MSEEIVDTTPNRAGGESFGGWLRQQREVRQIELREIADRTKISVRYLRAMEQDRFDLLPGSIFAKGFLREYAKYLGLDPDEAVNFYLSTRLEDEPEEEDVVPEQPAIPRVWSRGLALALLAIVLLAVASFFLFSYLERNRDRSTQDSPPYGPPVQQQPDPSPEEPPESTSSTELADGTSAHPSPLLVTVDFSRDCWVEIVIDGDERLDQRFVQGESLQLSAQQSVEFRTLGNAGGVSLQVNGFPYPLEAREGEVLHDLRIDLETARTLASEGE
jgi:cytoskeletal protein RodZ